MNKTQEEEKIIPSPFNRGMKKIHFKPFNALDIIARCIGFQALLYQDRYQQYKVD